MDMMISSLEKILNFFSVLKLKSKGVKVIGNKVYLRRGNRIYGKGSNIQIDARERVYLGPDSMITCVGGVQIGSNLRVAEKLRLTSWEKVIIGDNVLLGSSVTIIDCNHGMRIDDISKGYGEQEMTAAPITIENGVWCGDHVIILPGVTIGEHAIVGAGSVVTKSIPKNCIAVGNPARVIKKWNFDNSQWERIGESTLT